MQTQGGKTRPFSQFVRIFVDQVGEKSTIESILRRKVQAWLTLEKNGSLRVAELLDMDR